ncbi:hypothetical protein FIBSPDRAFT_951240 [Athelia psychrophila]|uniref:BTB domain-containing protein n=1 Tax=Athelia psychrophila TaxID=1759441 RepID=A0A166MZM1_9AGAM|nr:hypothetical protein FIBSPDRAFT_951240 [Fibularhizoctonia sp. CBS 109695]
MAQRESTDNPSFTEAASPFDDPKADVILRSSDNVDFRCYKILLSLTSTFFEGMFSLPQASIEDDVLMKDGLQIVPMEEKASILEAVLRLCHPSSIRNPLILELDDIKSVYDTARKYVMEDVEETIRNTLISARFLEQAPMRVFGIACALRLGAEAQIAAAATLESDLGDLVYFPELEYLSGGDIYHLQLYHKACRNVAQEVIGDVRELKMGVAISYRWFTCNENSKICHCIPIPGNLVEAEAAKWWIYSYLAPCQRQLKTAPMGKKVKTTRRLGAALVAAQACPECKQTSFEDLEYFAERFGEEIDKAVAKVPLQLSWMAVEDKAAEE